MAHLFIGSPLSEALSAAGRQAQALDAEVLALLRRATGA